MATAIEDHGLGATDLVGELLRDAGRTHGILIAGSRAIRTDHAKAGQRAPSPENYKEPDLLRCERSTRCSIMMLSTSFVVLIVVRSFMAFRYCSCVARSIS